MERIERHGLDPPLFPTTMEAVKRFGAVLVVAILFFAACKEQEQTAAPEKPKETPLTKVEEILTVVEGGKKEEPVVPPVTPPGVETNPEIPVAQPVPDKPGFVISPFNGKWIDVAGSKPGDVLADPLFSPEEKKYFKVPEFPIPEAVEPPVEPADPAPEDGAPAPAGETQEAPGDSPKSEGDPGDAE